MRISKTLTVIAAAASVAFSVPAFADSMIFNSGDINKSVTLDYNGFNGSNIPADQISGLTGSTTFTLTGVSGNDYTFGYTVKNTTSAPVTDSRISGFAFNTDPTISGASSTGLFQYTALTANYPNAIGTVDVCFKDQASTNSCAGGANGGVTAGQSGTGSFTLSFSSPVSALTLSDFYVRYQSITGVPGISSASGAGTISTSSTSTSTGGTAVPEPGMIGLFGAGLIGLAITRRRQTVRQLVRRAA